MKGGKRVTYIGGLTPKGSSLFVIKFKKHD